MHCYMRQKLPKFPEYLDGIQFGKDKKEFLTIVLKQKPF